MATTEDDYWAEAERIGRITGHVVCRCPRCDQRCIVSYRPRSQPWPRCRSCLMPTVEIPVRWGQPRRVSREPAPRIEPVSDPALVVHKRPGEPRTARQLLRDGCIIAPTTSTAQEGA
jgi:hypothetical protein